MTDPIIMAKNVIKDADFDWVDRIMTGSGPIRDNNQIDVNKTTIVITELASAPIGYANETFKMWQVGVEVQIFYKLNVQFSLMNKDIIMSRLFKKNGWEIDQSKNHILDPDTNQVSKVFYFTKNIVLKGE